MSDHNPLTDDPEVGPPPVWVGMKISTIMRKVNSAGLSPDRVVVQYAGCGSHEIELEIVGADYEEPNILDLVDVEKLKLIPEDKLSEEQKRAIRRHQDLEEKREAAAEREIEDTEIADDPTQGW